MSARRVLLLCGYYYPDSVGGTEKYVHLLARDLRAQGLDVVIAAPSQDEREREYRHDGFTVFRYPIDPEPERAEVRGEIAPRYLDRFGSWLDELQPDLVHMHSITRGCGYWHARQVRARRIPLVLTVHVPSVTCVRGTMLRWGTTPCDGAMLDTRCTACFLQSQGLPTPLARGVATIPNSLAASIAARPERSVARLGLRSVISKEHDRTRQLLAMADRVVAVADWLAEVLRQNGCAPDKLLVSRHGLGADELQPHAAQRSSTGRFELGYIGRLDPTKGLDRVVGAVRLMDRALSVGLSIYGGARADEQRAYQTRLERLSQGDARIQFRGEVTAANRAQVFGNLDALVVPSVWLETGPMVVLEAFAAGIPVIGSAHSGIAELVTHGVSGLLVEDATPEGWAKALSNAQARFVADDWHWMIPRVRASQDVAAEMRSVYDSLWGNAARRAA
jgi:glycosyltransferase involved in cell wall biosynthesis